MLINIFAMLRIKTEKNQMISDFIYAMRTFSNSIIAAHSTAFNRAASGQCIKNINKLIKSASIALADFLESRSYRIKNKRCR